MDESPLISVIVPVYNSAKYLYRSVEVILAQTYRNLEIILIDDGSDDDSVRICQQYAEKDNRIKVVPNRHGGTAITRNTGLNIAKGDYIGFVDSDDIIENNMFEILLNDCLKSGKDIACSNRMTRYTDKDELFKIVEKSCEMSAEEAVKRLLTVNDFSLCNKLYNRRIFDEIRFVEGVTYEDTIPSIKTVIVSNGVYFEESYLYIYIQSSTSMTHRPFEKTKMDYVYNMNIMVNEVKKAFDNLDDICDACCINAITGLIPDVYPVRDKYSEEFDYLIKELGKYRSTYKKNDYVNRNNRIKTFFNLHNMTGTACKLGNIYASLKQR